MKNKKLMLKFIHNFYEECILNMYSYCIDFFCSHQKDIWLLSMMNKAKFNCHGISDWKSFIVNHVLSAVLNSLHLNSN